MVRSPDGCWHAYKNVIRTGTLTTGTATAFDCAFAPCDGSDLLSLRLLSTCSWVTRFSRRPKLGRLAGYCLSRAAPRRVVSLARPAGCASRALWRVRPLPNTSLRPGRAVAAVTLWVTASVQGPKLALDLTRLGSGFYSRLAAQLLFRNNWIGCDRSRGTGDICQTAACAAEGVIAPVATILSPVARDYPSRAFGGFFMPPRCDCSIKERNETCVRLGQSHGFLADNFFTAAARWITCA
jgi:hypothetical protein